MKNELISRAGLVKLKAELEAVDAEIQKTLNEMGESAKRDNDLRENPEFMELRVKAMHTLPAQKEKLYWKIKEAIIIEDTSEYKEFDGTTVIVGATVTFTMDGAEKKFTILGSTEGDLKSCILACDAPLAQAMLGKHMGDTFSFNSRTIVIKKIEKI